MLEKMSSMELYFCISKLSGGGAEHVVFILANYFHSQGVACTIIVTNQSGKCANVAGLNPSVKLIFVEDEIESNRYTLYEKIAHGVCHLYEKFRLRAGDYWVKKSFFSLYRNHIERVRQILQQASSPVLISFLQPSVPISLIAAEGLDCPIILSERSDPARFFRTRYADFQMRHYYRYAPKIVFQTPDALKVYPEELHSKGVVIPNPVKDGLPERHTGPREKKIVNFCRLSAQKNISLLIEAFTIFHKKHPDYELEIIGDGELKDDVTRLIWASEAGERIKLIPHMDNVHAHVLKYTMFVSSSDWEGMSNSMLEAMAIGLPVICTDCPIGGASSIITDHENGLLVPVRQAEKLAAAMAEVADDNGLQTKLSENGAHIKESLSMAKICSLWENLICDLSGGQNADK